MIFLPRFRDIELPRARVGAKGRFKVRKFKQYGDLSVLMHETPWFDNLILDSGLNRWGTGNVSGGAAVGSSSTPPNVGQTGLIAQATFTNTTGPDHNTLSAQGVSPYVNTRTLVYRTALGALNGNYTEVGIGWASGSMFSRALIVDSGGTPTALSVAADEQLDVVYQFGVYPPLTDTAHTAVIGGVTYNITGRAANVNATTGNYPWAASMLGPISMNQPFAGDNWVYNGSIGTIEQLPSGASASGGAASNAAYVNNSLSRTGTMTAGPTQGNVSGGINCHRARFGDLATFQYQFDALIPKDATKTLTLTSSITWGRH